MLESSESESQREARGETGSIRLSSINCKLITISNGLGVSDAKDFVKNIFIIYVGSLGSGGRGGGGSQRKYESLRVFFYQMLVMVIYLGPRQTLHAGWFRQYLQHNRLLSTKNCSGPNPSLLSSFSLSRQTRSTPVSLLSISSPLQTSKIKTD